MFRRINFKLAVPVTMAVLAVLIIAKKGHFKVPYPTIVFIGAMFAVCSLVFWSLQREGKTSALAQLAIWLLSWSLLTGSALGAVYHFDKAGWMWFTLTGYNVTQVENLDDRVNVPVAAFVARYPFFVLEPRDSTRLLIKSGAHDFDETIVVPPELSLTIAPGAILRFGVGCSLVSYSPIAAVGTAETPIIFTAQNQWRKWGVVAIVRAPGKSIFEHARFEHGRQAMVNGIDFPATLSFNETEAEVRHCWFVNMFGKDASNTNGGWGLYRNNLFRNCFNDGIDFDGAAGEISHNRFEHCGSEAIDLSEESRVQVFDNCIFDANDAPQDGVRKWRDES